MAYRYTLDQWFDIKRRREEEDRAMKIAHAEDMDIWSALREEQCRGEGFDLTSLAEQKGLV